MRERSIQAIVLLVWMLATLGVLRAGENLVSEYYEPALDWERFALPIGNGFLGGMIFGGVEVERIHFNEESLWTGSQKFRGYYRPFGDVLINMVGGCTMLPEYRISLPRNFSNNYELSIDNDLDTCWSERFQISGDPTKWVVEFAEKTTLTSYSMTSSPKGRGKDMPRWWEFQGSSDGKNWVTLDEQKKTGVWTESSQEKKFTFKNNKAYNQYRFLFKATKEPNEKQKKSRWHPEQFKIAEISFDGLVSMQYANYRRGLNIEDAVSFVSYEANGVKFKREYFCSNPAGVMVMRLTADKPGQYTGTILFRDANGTDSSVEGRRISFNGALENGLKYEAQLHVINDGGELVSDGDNLSFKNADSLTLFLSAGTDYLPDMSKGWRGEHPHRKVTERLDGAVSRRYSKLLAEHIKDYKSIFGRVEFDVAGAKRGDMPFDKRLEAYAGGAEDLYLERFLFHMGRYLLISCSRPGCLPANLQGLWNNRWTAAWASDYHVNINLQMSYWPALNANMHEIHMQYINWVLSQIPGYRLGLKQAVERGDKNMKREPRWDSLPRGWTTRTEANIYGAGGYRWCETANAWHMQHFWEQYAFTQDKEYLRKVAYPAMKEVCQYWEDRLKKRKDRTLVVPDGWSPEHGPEEDGVTYDQMLVWDLFNNFVQASDVLGVDREYRDKIADMRGRLLAPKVGSWGQLQEWEEDKDDPEEMHRHFSHLIGLYPGRQISPQTTPVLAAAAEVTLRTKQKAMAELDPGFWKMTGWDKAWRISMWARLGRGDESYKMVRELIRYRVHPNMMSVCPPLVLDANWGYVAGVVETLLQSHDRIYKPDGQEVYELQILPALMPKWPTGSVKGVTARGAFEVDIDWADMKATKIKIMSKAGKVCRVRTGRKITDISGVDADKVNRPEKNVIEFPTKKGGVYVLKR